MASYGIRVGDRVKFKYGLSFAGDDNVTAKLFDIDKDDLLTKPDVAMLKFWFVGRVVKRLGECKHSPYHKWLTLVELYPRIHGKRFCVVGERDLVLKDRKDEFMVEDLSI